MKKLSKIFLLLLLVLTLCTVCALTVFAEEGANEEATVPEGSAIEYTDAEGSVTYHAADDFSALVIAGGKIKLLADIETDCAPISVKNSVVIDLNGYDFTRVVYYGKFYEATDNGDGTYTYGDTLVSSTTGHSVRDVFAIQNDEIDFTFYSSTGRSSVYNIVAYAKTWSIGETVVKREIISYFNSNLILSTYVDYKYYGENINYNISNVDLYMQSIFYQTHGSGSFNFTIDNINHFHMKYTASGDTYEAGYTFMMGSKSDVIINVTNSIFYSPLASTPFLRFVDSPYSGKVCNVTFKNCDIIKTQTSYSYGNSNKRTDAVIIMDDCRVCDMAGVKASNGSIFPVASDAGYPTMLEGFTRQTITTKKISYVVPSATGFTTNTSSDVQVPNLEFATKTVDIYFSAMATKEIALTWMKGDEVVKTETVTPGITAFATPSLDPYYDDSDDYRNIAYQWADAAEGGKAVTEIPGWEDSYTFYAVTEIDGVKNYVAGLKGAMLNMTYMAHFQYNFYLPVVEGVEITKVAVGSSVKSKSATNIWISDVECYAYVIGYPTSTGALENTTVTVTYTVDGQSFTAKFTFNVLDYAELAYQHEKATEVEKEALACLVRYIHESYKFKATNNTLDEATEKIFQDYYTNYRTPADYVTEYPTKELHTFKEDLLKDYIESVHFTVIGSKVTFAVTLTDKAVANNCRILFGTVGYKDKISADGKTYYTDNRSLYQNLMAASYTITVTDSAYNTLKVDTDGDGTVDTALETKYSMATYIKSMEDAGKDVPLAKALYAFGKATIAVRAQIYN